MPATGLVIGTPAAIRPSVAPQTDAIELEPFDSRMSEITRSCRGICRGRAARVDAPLGESMPWPISRRPGPRIGRHSPTEKRREVVVEHEPLRVFLEQAVDSLLIAPGAERDGDQRLRLAALEHRGTVHAAGSRRRRNRADEDHRRRDRPGVCLRGSFRGRPSLPGRATPCRTRRSRWRLRRRGRGSTPPSPRSSASRTPRRGPACRRSASRP